MKRVCLNNVEVTGDLEILGVQARIFVKTLIVRVQSLSNGHRSPGTLGAKPVELFYSQVLGKRKCLLSFRIVEKLLSLKNMKRTKRLLMLKFANVKQICRPNLWTIYSGIGMKQVCTYFAWLHVQIWSIDFGVYLVYS